MSFDDALRRDEMAKRHLSEKTESDLFEAVLCQASPVTAEPLRPKQFYLDTALAYDAAVERGELETDVAQRAHVHVRTVRWYRRIAAFPLECQNLIRLYPRLFQATWAVQMVRRGPNSTYPDLLTQMQQMVTAGRTWVKKRSGPSAKSHGPTKFTPVVENHVLASLRRRLNDPAAAELSNFTRTFLQLLVQGQLLDNVAHTNIVQSLWRAETTRGVGDDAAKNSAARSWRSKVSDAKSP